MPEGKGLWPAIWLLPANNTYGGWPASGEIDLMELIGQEPSRVYQTIHYGTSNPYNHQHKGNHFTLNGGARFSQGFNVFKLVWK